MSSTKLTEKFDLYESVQEHCRELAKKDRLRERNNIFSFNSKYVDNRTANLHEKENMTQKLIPTKQILEYQINLLVTHTQKKS